MADVVEVATTNRFAFQLTVIHRSSLDAGSPAAATNVGGGHRAAGRGPWSARQTRCPLLQQAALGLVLGEFRRTQVGQPSLCRPTQALQHIGLRSS